VGLGDPARNPAMEHMLYAAYITLGLFLIAWARNPERALPLTNWVIVANLVHGTVMLVHALTMPHGHDHLTLTGDVVGTYSAPLLLLASHPRLLRRSIVTTAPQNAPGSN
jgi:drug/metabolite transporter (DMT)-like permease